MPEKTIFKRIIDREIPAEIVYEDDQCLAFKDIRPQAPVHILLIPKKEIPTLDDVVDQDAAWMGHLFVAVRKIAAQFDLKDGYRVVINCKEAAGQEVPHLHLHLLGGRSLTWPPG
jgi:histidine triad (HIT) family protein